MPLLGCPIIEPFAGSAAYSLYHHHHQVKLFDKYSVICELWDYLINVSESELLSLPLLDFGEQIPTNIPQAAQHLMGFWVSRASTQPKRSRRKTRWKREGRKADNPGGEWSAQTRAMIASQLQHIRHWTIEQRDYSSIDPEEGTWFVDPPYQVKGSNYVHNEIDYAKLLLWCQSLPGQTIVCENSQSDWLSDATPLHETSGSRHSTIEIMYHSINPNPTPRR
tara:strand:+ start:1305 stop:1970 length:666 start_codon:yes stop_codon:yes gene_type:complete